MDPNGTPHLPKTFFEGFERKVADVVTPMAARAGYPTDRLAVAAVQGKGHTQLGVIVTTKLKIVRAQRALLVSTAQRATSSCTGRLSCHRSCRA